MFTISKKIVLDFDSEYLSVMENGVLVMHSPSSVVRKKSENPSLVYACEEAEKNKFKLKDNELYVRPFKNGKIKDETAARLLFQYALRKLFGRNKFIDIFIIVSGGINEGDAQVIARALAASGYGRLNFLPRPKLMAQFLSRYNRFAMVYMDNDVTELVLAANGDIRCAHCVDVSVSALREILRDRLLTGNKIKINDDDSLNNVIKNLSLFPNDGTKIFCRGTDTITSSSKSIYFSAKDAYPVCENIYKKITDFICAVLLDENKEFALQVAEKGIIFAGVGTKILGFQEFFYEKLGFSGVIAEDNYLLLTQANYYATTRSDI